jgi:hypothetical protein
VLGRQKCVNLKGNTKQDYNLGENSVTIDGINGNILRQEKLNQEKNDEKGISHYHIRIKETKNNARDNYYTLNNYINPSLRAHHAPPAEEPRYARMTDYGIPI